MKYFLARMMYYFANGMRIAKPFNEYFNEYYEWGKRSLVIFLFLLAIVFLLNILYWFSSKKGE